MKAFLIFAVAMVVVPLILGQFVTLHAEKEGEMKTEVMPENAEAATFAGGCFWCMEPPFDKLDGVISTTAGYMGGTVENPTYEQVTTGTTGHAEVIQVAYDPEKVSYTELLNVFWRNINPLTLNRQFADVGTQYRTAIFYHNEEQRRAAEASKKEMETVGKFKGETIVTEISPAGPFYKAEKYHQDYYMKNPLHYKAYHHGSGRGPYLKKLWGDEKSPE